MALMALVSMHGLTPRSFFSQLARAVDKDAPFDMAAQLAYWNLLALFPFAIFVLTLIGYLPLEGVAEQVLDIIYAVMPADAAKLFDTVIHEVVGKQRGPLLILALVGAVWSSSGGVSATVTALNRAQEVDESRPYWKVKLIALGVTIAAAVLIVVSTAALAVGPRFAHEAWAWFGLGGLFDLLWRILRWPTVFGAMMLLLAMVYWVLPAVRRPFRFISPGAVVAMVLWLGASLLFGVYTAHFSSYAKSYGTLGTAVVLMTWLYLSGLAVILGGEINAILDRAAANDSEEPNRSDRPQPQKPSASAPSEQVAGRPATPNRNVAPVVADDGVD